MKRIIKKHFSPFRSKIRNYFATGLLTVLPIVVTFVVIDLLLKLINKYIPPFSLAQITFPGSHIIFSLCKIFLAFIVIILIGIFTANWMGKRFFEWWEHLLTKVPLVRTIYTTTKQSADFILSKPKEHFSRVVLVEYPRKGIYTFGFVTSTGNQMLKEAIGNKDVVTVFIPTVVNIASGFLLIVPSDEVIDIDMTVEDGFKVIVSAGVITPSLTGNKRNILPFHKDKKDIENKNSQ
jgi:uncharacterized membrane protein